MFRYFGLALLGLALSAGASFATCPTFHTLSNGSTADATQVMDNFNYILNCPNFLGNVGIGVAPSSAVKLYITGDPGYASGFSSSVLNDPTWASGSLTVAGSIYDSYFSLSGSSTVGLVNSYQANGGTAGSATLTSYVGFYLNQWPTGTVTNKYAFRSSGAAGANNYGVYIDSAQSYFGGSVGVGTTSPAGALDIYGASNINGVSISGNTSTNPPAIAAVSSSNANLDLNIASKGTGSISFISGGNPQLKVTNFVGATDYLQIFGGGPSNAVAMQATGADTNVGLWMATKGSGEFYFVGYGVKQAVILPTSSATNYLALQASSTGGPAILNASGSDTDVGLRLKTQGAGIIDFFTSVRQARILHTASAVDYLTFTGGVTGSPGTVTIGAAGTDTNVNIAITPQGSGNVVLNGQTKISSLASASATAVCINGSNILSSCSSSLRYKENIRDAAFGLKQVLAMRPVTFKWKGRDENDFGFIAEEMAKIDPLFATYKDGKIEGVKYPQITAVLVNAVKELQAENVALKSALKLASDRRARELAELRKSQASAIREVQVQIAMLRREQRQISARTAQN